MNFACVIGSYCQTTANGREMSPPQKWTEMIPSMKGLFAFGTIGYLRIPKRKHKFEPRDRKCVLIR